MQRRIGQADKKVDFITILFVSTVCSAAAVRERAFPITPKWSPPLSPDNILGGRARERIAAKSMGERRVGEGRYGHF